MSDEDPWKGWYQPEQPPAGAPGSDATHDMTISSRMPPSPGNGPGAGGGRGAWPEQPPPVSSPGGSGSPYGGCGYRRTVPAVPGRCSGYGGGPGYGAPYGTSTYGGAPTRGGGRRWRFWGQPGRRGRRIALIIGVVVLVIIARDRRHVLLGQREAEPDRQPARLHRHLGRDELADRRVRPARPGSAAPSGRSCTWARTARTPPTR